MKDLKPDRRLPWKSAGSLSQLLRPVDGGDVDAERVLAEHVGGGWRLKRDGEDGGPARGVGERAILVAVLDPFDAEARWGSADHARDIDGDLLLAELGERIVGARVVIERLRA